MFRHLKYRTEGWIRMITAHRQYLQRNLSNRFDQFKLRELGELPSLPDDEHRIANVGNLMELGAILDKYDSAANALADMNPHIADPKLRTKLNDILNPQHDTVQRHANLSWVSMPSGLQSGWIGALGGATLGLIVVFITLKRYPP